MCLSRAVSLLASPSCPGVMVTVCGALQLLIVKVSDEVTVTSALLLAIFTVTSLDGSVASATR